MKMKTSSTPCLVLIAALVREVICHKTPPRADVPVVGLASVAPIGSNASRRLAPSSSTRSSSEPRPRPSGQADLIQALETDKEVTGEETPDIPYPPPLRDNLRHV